MAAHSKRHRLTYFLVAGGGLIFFWRGIWGLLDLYLLPHFPAASYIISVVIGIVLLIIDDRVLDETRHH